MLKRAAHTASWLLGSVGDLAMAKRAKLLSESQVAKLIGVTTGEQLSRRDRALVEVLYGSGIRVSELCGLNVENLNLSSRRAMVFGKGKKWRPVPLTSAAVEAVQAYLTWRKHGPDFLNTAGNRLIPRLARRIVAKYARKAFLPHSSPHTLRHTFASHMLKNGAYLFNVQDMLGHAHPQTTAGYLHRMPVERTAEEDYRQSHPRA